MGNKVLEYLNSLPGREREALENIRQQILNIMPEGEERLSRRVPFFYYRGKRAVGFRSSKAHLSFFIMEGDVLEQHRKELSDYSTSSTIIRFHPENPLEEAIIKKLVLARMGEIEKSLQTKTKKYGQQKVKSAKRQ